MKNKKLIIFGTGELAELANFYFTKDSNHIVCGFTVNKEFIKSDTYLDLPLVPFDEVASRFPPVECDLFVAVGYSNLNENRKAKYFEAKELGYKLASYVSTKNSVWDDFTVGENTFIMENNTIMPFAKVGNNVLVFVGNIIAHHMIIEDHATLTSHCAIGGNVIIREGAFLGLNCTIRNGVVVNKKAIVSTSSNVVKDVAEFDVVMGNPAKSIGKRSTEITL